MEKKKCLQCKEEYQPKKSTSKFCSTSCRVMWGRKNKSTVSPNIQMKVLVNTILEKLENIQFTQINYPVLDAPKIENLTHDEPKQWQEPKVSSKSFQQYMNEIAGLEYEQEFKDKAAEIQSDAFLSQKQKDLLFINMRTSKL